MGKYVKTVTVTVQKSRAKYDVYQDSEATYLDPITEGSVASSLTEYSDYSYTHGGQLYRAAVEAAKAIERARAQEELESCRVALFDEQARLDKEIAEKL